MNLDGYKTYIAAGITWAAMTMGIIFGVPDAEEQGNILQTNIEAILVAVNTIGNILVVWGRAVAKHPGPLAK